MLSGLAVRVFQGGPPKRHMALPLGLLLLTLVGAGAAALPDPLSAPRRQCSAVTIAPEFGGLAIFAGGYTHGAGNSADSSGKAVDVFDR